MNSLTDAQVRSIKTGLGRFANEPRAVARKGKMPIDPRTGAGAKANDPSTWGSLDQALSRARQSNLDGIGVELGGGLCCIDLDHCIERNAINEMAQAVLSEMGATYTEISMSGTGLHVFFIADKLPDGSRKSGFEIYEAGRYIALTGKPYGELHPVAERTEQAKRLHARFIGEKAQQKPAPATKAKILGGDSEVINRAQNAKNGAAFRALWQGDITAYAGDWSRADSALCMMLAFWTNDDSARIDSLFRQSGLMRSKWDERHGAQTYGELTIKNAIRDRAHGSALLGVNHDPIMQPSKPDLLAGLRCVSDVEYEPVKWLIEPYFPLGKLTIVQGDPGTGKTALECAVAAAVSAGKSILNSPVSGGPGNVLLLSTEDDPSTLRGRIEASGGDLRRCTLHDEAYRITFSNPEIEQMIEQTRARLVIFDPLQSFLGAKVDMHRSNETRPILARLAAIAKNHECAIVIISHQNKTNMKAIFRTAGSIDIIGAARSALMIGRNPNDDEQRVAVHIKSSNARAGQSILYRIGDRGGVTFDGYSDLTADEIDQPAQKKERAVDYDSEPVVQLCRWYMAQSPNGARVSYEDFRIKGLEILGFQPFVRDSRELKPVFGRIASEMAQRDKIVVTLGIYVGRSKGLAINPHKPAASFQTGLS